MYRFCLGVILFLHRSPVSGFSDFSCELGMIICSCSVVPIPCSRREVHWVSPVDAGHKHSVGSMLSKFTPEPYKDAKRHVLLNRCIERMSVYPQGYKFP